MSTNTNTVQAARLLLTRLGLSPEDLLREPAQVPTFAEWGCPVLTDRVDEV